MDIRRVNEFAKWNRVDSSGQPCWLEAVEENWIQNFVEKRGYG